MKTLIVELVVTEECNLTCNYCYMHNKKTLMTKDVLHKFMKNIHVLMSAYNCDKYHISYFGGEPLMNWDLVKYAIEYFKKDPRLDSQVLITNGILLTDKEKYDFIRSSGCGISLSFDGLWNEENRPMVGGQSSFDHYIKHKEFYKQFRGCKVMVGPQNLDTLVENFIFFVDEMEYPIPDFTLVRDDIWTWDAVKNFRVRIKELGDEVIKRISSGKIQSTGLFRLWLLDTILSAKVGKRPMGCYAGCGGVGYLPDGVFYPCARYGTDKEYPLYDTNTNMFFKENFEFLNQSKFCNPIVYDECKDCDIRLACTGGCNYSLAKNGNFERAKPIDQVCELYKAIYYETLRIHNELKDNNFYKKYINIIIGEIKNFIRK